MLAVSDEFGEVGGLVHVVAVLLAHLAERLNARGQFALLHRRNIACLPAPVKVRPGLGAKIDLCENRPTPQTA